MDRGEFIQAMVERTGMSPEAAEETLELLLESLSRPPEEVKLPPYFDRYVTTEIRHLSSQIEHLREDMDSRFEALRVDMDSRFEHLQGDMERRFGEVNRRFEEVDRRFEDINRRFEEVDRRFDRLERWFLMVGVPIVVGILAIIVKIFFGGP